MPNCQISPNLFCQDGIHDCYLLTLHRFHATAARIQTGTVADGQMSFGVQLDDDDGALSGSTWHALEIVVEQVTMMATVHLNSVNPGRYRFSNTARGHGGVIIANGYENIGRFRSFSIR
jgi:hypothetical protein